MWYILQELLLNAVEKLLKSDAFQKLIIIKYLIHKGKFVVYCIIDIKLKLWKPGN